MVRLMLLLALRFVVPCPPCASDASLAIAVSQVGVAEATGHNDGPQIERYQRAVGLHRGDPYCAAFQVWSFDSAGHQPLARTGLANGLYNDAARRGRKSEGYRVGDLVVWKFSQSASGHVARIVKVGQAGWCTTVEANTSPTTTGDQRNGGGVYLKHRQMRHPLGKMFVRGFVGFR